MGPTFDKHTNILTLVDNGDAWGANHQYVKLTPLLSDRWVIHIMLNTGFVMSVDCKDGGPITIADDIIKASNSYERSRGKITYEEAQEIEKLVCVMIGAPNGQSIALPPIGTIDPIEKLARWLTWLIRISDGLQLNQILEQLKTHYSKSNPDVY